MATSETSGPSFSSHPLVGSSQARLSRRSLI